MSYSRVSSSPTYFKVNSMMPYVFASYDGYIEDYDFDYNQDPSVTCELIMRIIERETTRILEQKDVVFLEKIQSFLAEKFDLEPIPIQESKR
jgi:hypothetical protein